jgi:hypothetical protein
MIRRRPRLRIRAGLVVFIAGLVVAVASPVEHGAGQTPPPPAPDPVPDTNPNPPPTGGSSGGDSTGSPGGSSGGDSPGSSRGSAGASPPPASDGTESSTNLRDGQESETTPEPKRQKQHADKPDQQTTAAPEARDPPARPAGIALGGGARPEASTPADLELFILALAGMLALVLLLLAATPPHVLAGVSVALAERQRKVEIGVAAVLMSLVIGLLAAQCGAQLR